MPLAGFKGYLSGIGYYNPTTKKLDVNFYDGGIVMEASAHVMERRSLWIANFGVSIDCGVFSTLGFLNRAAANGDVAATPKIDMITESRFNLSIGAWAEASLDILIAKAAIGVAGSATIDVRSGTVTPTYQKKAYAGNRVSLDFNLWAYLTARFLWWGGTTDYTILSANDTIYDPNNSTNPYHPNFELGGKPIFSMSRKSVPQNYKKLSRKTRRALEGTKLLDNVSGMAQPTYLMGGNSLLFNNLKSVSDYNDDRLQVFDGNNTNLVDTGVEAPMYAFAEDHSDQTEVVAFEQLNSAVNAEALEGAEVISQQKAVSEMCEIHTAWRTDGGGWQTQKIGSLQGSACVSPAVAVSKENYYATHAAVIWQQGKAKFTDAGERYIDGSLMLARFDGNEWSEPIELMRINHRNVPVEYKATIKLDGNNDQVLVAMAVKQDAYNPNEDTKLVYLNAQIDQFGDYKVKTRYTNVEAKMLQMERVLDPNSLQTFNGQDYGYADGANLVAYMENTDNGRDLRLTAVDMTGKPTDKLNGKVGMVGRMVNDYRLVVDDNARDLSGVALLWNQSDGEKTDNGDGTQTVEIKNRIYASKLCSEDQQIYFSSPIAVADIENGTEKMVLASMDGYLNGLDMKVAYSAANYSDAASVREVTVGFTNDIEHTASFNPYDVNSPEQVPVNITVENKGFEPIDRIDVTMNGEITSYDVKIMPMGKINLKVPCPVTDDFDGTITYDLSANFVEANSNALKARRSRAAASKAPRRTVSLSGTQLNVRQVDMALKVLSKKTDAQGVTTIVAEVNNASQLPLANDMSVKVGLYNSPVVDDNAVSFADVTVSASDLYDATAKQNKVKLVTLSVQQPDIDQTLYLCTTPMQDGEAVNDVRPTNNVLPLGFKGKHLKGDVNSDGKVDVADIASAISVMAGTASYPYADVNEDAQVDVADIASIISIMAASSRRAEPTDSQLP